MDAIVAAALNEISARGEQGCLLQHLWSGLQSAAASAGLHLCDGVKQTIWQSLLKVPGLSFGAPGSSMDRIFLNSHPSIQAVEAAERLGLNIVAPEHLRDSCVGLYDLKFSDAGLSADQRFALERLATARTQGVTQNQLAKEFGIKGNKLFYIVRSLESRGLLVRQSTLVRTKGGGSEAENGLKCNSIVNTNLIHLSRYAKHLNLGSQQRFEIRKSNASEFIEDRNMPSGMEGSGQGGREDLLIKDDLPAMKSVCDKLEESDGKVLVVSDLKVSLGYRMTVGHRAWRRISKRLMAAGLVELFQARIDKKVVQCIRLLKSFDAKAFHPKVPNSGNDDYEPETIKKIKRGQATEQLVEIPIDHQIYDMIDSEGSKGLTVTEMWKRLGLNNKRNYYRLTNMVSRFGLHLQAESHKRSMHYRVWTSSNLNSYSNDCPTNNQQNVPREMYGSELALVDGGGRLLGGSYNPSAERFNSMRKSHKQEEAAPQCGRLKIKIKQRRSGIDKGGCNLADNSRALVCAETTIKQSDPDDHMYEGAENIFPKTTRTQNLRFDEKVHMPQPINTTAPMLRAGQRYPCLTVTTSSAQREQRILERLHVDKFILRVELYRWLEDLEKGKSTTMDRKTLTRALQRLQNEGHCKSILVSVPVVTNCGRSRTTEVVLHPSVEVGPELMGQIHEKLRNFEMQSRGQGLARSKNDDSVPILTGIKRTSNSEPSDFQSIRAESMRANGFIPAKMVRIKLLHQFLWGYVSSLQDWDAALSSGKHGYDLKNPNSTCKLFSLDSAIKAMPLELFLQVIGSVKKIGDLAESCRLGLCLCDLPEQEFKCLMDTQATGRLSWLIDVIRRLKLLRLVMIKGHEEEDGNAVPQAVLTYAMELKPYIEEPAPRAVPSLNVNVFDLRPRVRHDFVLSSRDALDAYWKTLEYCFCAADPTVAARAFPGSSVPEIFLQRSWTSVRVMSVDQRTELLKRVANDDLEKRMSFKECVKIAKDLNLTLEQVLRVSYEKNRKARLMASQRESTKPFGPDDKMKTCIKTQRHSPKRKRSSLEESSECENMEIQLKRSYFQSDIVPYEGSGKNGDLYDGNQVDKGHNDFKKAHFEGSYGDGEDQDDVDDEDANDDIFINHISSLSRLKPTRKRRFPWTDSLERSLITSYARYRATLGARFHRVDWVAVPGLPAPPQTCRRRIASFKHEPAVRKALMNLCNLLAARYAKHLQQMEREQVDDVDIGISEGPSQLYPLWDDFEEPSIAAAVDEVMRCKCMAKLSAVKRIGGSSTFVVKWSESAPSEKFTSNVPGDNGFGPTYDGKHPCSYAEHAPKVSSFASACVVPEVSVLASSSSSMGCVMVSGSADAHPPGRVNIGGGRTRANRRRLPKKVQKLLENEDFSTEKLVHKSVAVANAVELIKLVFLNSSANSEVPQVLVDSLRRYSEFDVFAAFNFLRAHGLVVVGHGVQPFVLSPKFFHNASASPFPIGTGEKASKFANWLTRVQKELEEDWISLPAELYCGDLFHLFGLVSSGDILIAPNLPNEGIGDADDPRGLKRKIDKEKASRDPQFAKPKLPWPREGELCTRRERGFPGIQVHVHCATIPMAEIVTRDLIDKDKVEDTAVGHSGQSDFDPDLSMVSVNHDLISNNNSGHIKGPKARSIESREHLLEALVTFAEEFVSIKTMQEEPAFFQSQWFESALDAIEKAGDEGLSLEQVAHSIGVDGNHIEQADAIVEALQSFNQIIKVNAFDHVRAFACPHSAKYSLLVSSDNHEDNKSVDARHHKDVTGTQKTNYGDIRKMYMQEDEGFRRPSFIPYINLDRQDRSMTVGDGHLVTILEIPEMDKTDAASYKQLDPHGIVSIGNTEKCDEQPETVLDFPAAQNLNLEQETNQREQNLLVDTRGQFLPILPWLGADGETNTVMLKALMRRVLGIVMQHPGILEDGLIKQLDILNPQSARKLIQLLELDDHLHVREMCESKRTPPNILKGLIGPNFDKQKPVSRKHYYANPTSTAML